jgi:hypothetical protein
VGLWQSNHATKREFYHRLHHCKRNRPHRQSKSPERVAPSSRLNWIDHFAACIHIEPFVSLFCCHFQLSMELHPKATRPPYCTRWDTTFTSTPFSLTYLSKQWTCCTHNTKRIYTVRRPRQQRGDSKWRSFRDFGETTTAVVMLSETIGLAVAITHLTLLIKTYTIVSSNFLPKSWQQTHHKEEEKSSTSVSYHVPSHKSGEHPKFRVTTAHVERAS